MPLFRPNRKSVAHRTATPATAAPQSDVPPDSTEVVAGGAAATPDPLAGLGEFQPLTRYFAAQISYYDELLEAVASQLASGARIDGEALAAKVRERREKIRDKGLALALAPSRPLPALVIPAELTSDTVSERALRRLLSPDVDLDSRLKGLAQLYRRKNHRALLALRQRLKRTDGSQRENLLVDTLEFMLAVEYLVPDVAAELGERLLTFNAAHPLLPDELEQLILEKVSVSLIKVGSYDRARARWSQLKGIKNFSAAAAHLQFADMMWRQDAEAALASLGIAGKLADKLSQGYFMLQMMLMLDQRGPDAAEKLLASRPKLGHDAIFALYNVVLRREGFPDAQSTLQHFFTLKDLAYPRFNGQDVLDVNAVASDLIDVAEVAEVKGERPLVTVIMTAFNAEATVREALRSLQMQSYRKLEIIVVDDMSEDRTVEIVRAAQAEDPRIRLLRNRGNIGTYLSRNRAMSQARGQFVTFQDSDDWSHPVRIERHLEVMIGNPHVAVSKSQWIRMMPDGTVPLRRWSRCFAHVNPSSLFIRKDALPVIGYFDAVRADADFEMARRIDLLFAEPAVRSIPVPLSIGFVGENSLTKSGATSMDEEGYSPVRAAYKRAWMSSYPDRVVEGALSLPALPDHYLYPVPEEMAADFEGAAQWFNEPAEEVKDAPKAKRIKEWGEHPPFWFAISLASAKSSANWERTVAVFRNTLRSLLNQSDPNFRIVVAGHERPKIEEMNDPRVDFIISDRTPPTLPKDFRADKMWKRRLIFQRIKMAGGGYFMPVDADDLISSRLVAHVRSRGLQPGFVVTKGYALDWTQRLLGAVPGVWNAPFERVCGSSAVFLLRADDIPHLHQQDVTGVAAALLGPHANWRLTAEEVGQPLEEVEFPASIYVVNTSVNLSFAMQRTGERADTLLRNLARAEVKPTPEMVAEFALNELYPELAGGTDNAAPDLAVTERAAE